MLLKFIICSMELLLNKKVIVVTGGSKGIGAGIVNVLVSEGAIPVIVGRNKKDISVWWYVCRFTFNTFLEFYSIKFKKNRS